MNFFLLLSILKLKGGDSKNKFCCSLPCVFLHILISSMYLLNYMFTYICIIDLTDDIGIIMLYILCNARIYRCVSSFTSTLLTVVSILSIFCGEVWTCLKFGFVEFGKFWAHINGSTSF